MTLNKEIKFKVNSSVKNSIYGIGKILSIDAENSHPISVLFEDSGITDDYTISGTHGLVTNTNIELIGQQNYG